jgi:RNA polymerase sigma-70 factor (ECF subfamily)
MQLPFREDLLIAALLRGDPSAFRTLDGWIGVVLGETLPAARPDWEDLRQEVRIRVFRNLARGSFDGRASLRTYVHRIAKNVCIDHVRMSARRREGPAVADEPTEESSAEASAARDLLAKLLDGIREEDRRLIRMVFLERLSYREVADRLGVPEGTVKSRMARCKERLLTRRRTLLGREKEAR